LRVPTATGRTVELTIGTSRVLSSASPGLAQELAHDRARILLAPGLLERARSGDRAAQHVVLHELAHVVLHHGLRDETGRDVEREANDLAATILALIGP
jgi:hypothetical protein